MDNGASWRCVLAVSTWELDAEVFGEGDWWKRLCEAVAQEAGWTVEHPVQVIRGRPHITFTCEADLNADEQHAQGKRIADECEDVIRRYRHARAAASLNSLRTLEAQLKELNGTSQDLIATANSAAATIKAGGDAAEALGHIGSLLGRIVKSAVAIADWSQGL